MLKPGMILCDRYEILDVIGAGGMSIVYKARCHRLNRNVAIKVLKPEFSSDKNFVTKFRVEAQASAGLTHPNIVNVYDVYDDEGIYFIVMELVDGITLKEYIAENGRLPMDKAIDFAIQIASGLEAAHESHVIHRDIKPQNIIVAKNGNLKITDFGIAKAATSNTLTSGAMGSVHYISPEQARGGYSDERSDIYSFGITMYEMVTGRVPFEGDNNVSVALMHIQSDIIPPRQYYPDIYSSLEKIIMKATQKKPERRYLTASALIADLKRVQNNPNIDIIVAPTSITNSPTQEWSKEEVKAIRDGAAAGVYRDPYNNSQLNAFTNNTPIQNEMGEIQPIGGITPITANSGRINQLFEEAPDWEEELDEPVPVPEPRKQSIKKVQDIDEDDDDDDDGIDAGLQKAVVIAGVAAAIIVAIIVMVIVGNVLGWFKFGNSGSETTGTGSGSDTASEQIQEVVMIDVTGVTQDAAIKMLKNAGIYEANITIQQVTDDEIQAGYVISQNYEKNDVVSVNDIIILSVSAGAEVLPVPNVVGYSDQQACVVLDEAGFDVAHAYEFSEDVEKDFVIRQSPDANSTAPKNSKITITVSNGSEKKEVITPNLYGLTKADAIATIEANKLVVNIISEEYHDTLAEGQVISQSIASNTPVEEGQTIDFVVSKGKEEKPVTYTANITGTITCNDVALDGRAVTVQVLFNGSPVFSQDVTVNAGGTYNISATVPNLEAEGGTADFAMVDDTGAGVTGSFTKGAINISYTKVEE